MKRILVTGGSGFIGTNLVESLLATDSAVLNIDVKQPRNPEHGAVFRKVDIEDLDVLHETFRDFAPTHVVHLAARVDLDEEVTVEAYGANVQGVENMVAAVSRQSSVRQCVFASTKLVCPTDHHVTSVDDCCPDTVYGRSKVLGERIVRDSTTMRCDWCIVRPTSIWGPWADFPYGKFFRMIERGWYFHPGHANPPRSFGYVGNIVFQTERILDAPREQVHQEIFYLSDYEIFTTRKWANTISMKLKNKQVRTLPEPVARGLARIGDLLKACGVKDPPLSSFRLRNMMADTTHIPLEPIQQLTGPLPFSMEQGVERTITWLKRSKSTLYP